MKDSIVVQITKKDTANCGPYTSTRTCLLVTALQRLGYKSVSAGGTSAHIGEHAFTITNWFILSDINLYPHGLVGKKIELRKI